MGRLRNCRESYGGGKGERGEEERVLGSEVNKPSEFFVKMTNIIEYIESDIQNIEVLRTDDPPSSMYEKIYLKGSLEGVLKAIQVSRSYSSVSGKHTISRWLDIFFSVLYQVEKILISMLKRFSQVEKILMREIEIIEKDSHKACMGTLSCNCSPLFISICYVDFFYKNHPKPMYLMCVTL